MAGVLTYAQETALSKRVREWEEKIKPRLLLEVRMVQHSQRKLQCVIVHSNLDDLDTLMSMLRYRISEIVWITEVLTSLSSFFLP